MYGEGLYMDDLTDMIEIALTAVIFCLATVLLISLVSGLTGFIL